MTMKEVLTSEINKSPDTFVSMGIALLFFGLYQKTDLYKTVSIEIIPFGISVLIVGIILYTVKALFNIRKGIKNSLSD